MAAPAGLRWAEKPRRPLTSTLTIQINGTQTFTASGGFAGYLWNTGSSSNPLAVNAGTIAGTFYYAITVTDSDGCNGTSDSSIVIVNLCTGMDELNDDSFITIFPNPTNETINVSLKNITNGSNVVIELYSLLGEKILQEETNGQAHMINIEKLSSGIYFLRCKMGENSYDKKIVIQ